MLGLARVGSSMATTLCWTETVFVETSELFAENAYIAATLLDSLSRRSSFLKERIMGMLPNLEADEK